MRAIISLKQITKAGGRAVYDFPKADSGPPASVCLSCSFQMEVLLIVNAFACPIRRSLHRIKLSDREQRHTKAYGVARMWTGSAVVMIRVMLAVSRAWPQRRERLQEGT